MRCFNSNLRKRSVIYFRIPQSNENILCHLSEKVINSSYKLNEAQGREVLSGVIKGNNKEIYTSYLSKGVYSIFFNQRDLPVLLVVKK